MRVLICGSRSWSDYSAVERVVASLPKDTVIIEGEARGADTFARLAAEKFGLEVEMYPAQWDKLGRSAGYRRNEEMLSMGRPDVVVYFADDLEKSFGTAHMVRIARTAKVRIVNGKEVK